MSRTLWQAQSPAQRRPVRSRSHRGRRSRLLSNLAGLAGHATPALDEISLPNRIASFTKGLPDTRLGEVEPGTYRPQGYRLLCGRNQVPYVAARICSRWSTSTGKSPVTVVQTTLRFTSAYAWISRCRIPMMSAQGIWGVSRCNADETLLAASPIISISFTSVSCNARSPRKVVACAAFRKARRLARGIQHVLEPYPVPNVHTERPLLQPPRRENTGSSLRRCANPLFYR